MGDADDDFDLAQDEDIFNEGELDIEADEDEEAAAGDETGEVSVVTDPNDPRNHRPGAKPVEGPRQTSPYMTKFEKARVIGTRALQISLGAPVTVPIEGESDPIVLAEKELAAKSMPFIVRRYLPNGDYEDWSIEELIVD
eukprot:Blabericola_migrator_1__3644@NODE_2091_length_3291_cov_110_778226_g1325_i0_p5_GENE_NODE_2091_length_3291_cov_110_778226_g1325_i0NODE_2091_length_3291_cov_110_778226_g1325_i0_p5_ORF_typecomplete_len140_score35_42RNA_pol_Rpb6/PF01192_22/3_6e03RNA_pol_Rpb6/PF01192_22/1_1e11_NODE_2091_length_3291_cov_110_778226_g1325_i026823101